MVYHDPLERPWYNNPKLGFLRLFVSDEQAAQLVRLGASGLSRFILIGFGVGWVIECAMPGDQVNNSVVAFVRRFQFKNKFLGKYSLLGIGAVFAYNGGRLVHYLHQKWSTHKRKLPAEEFPNKFFWVSDAEGNAPEGAKGVMFNKKLNRWMTQPVRTQELGHDRAFNYDGISFIDFVKTEITIGWEYPFKAMFHCIAHYFGTKRWSTPGIDANLRKTMYKGVINTGLAVFIVDDPSNPLHGHSVIDKVMLQFSQNSTRLFDRIVIYLDHDNWEVEKMTLEWTNFAGETEKETWGSRDVTENARPDLNLSPEASLAEAGKVCVAIIADYTHGTTHMWANGTFTINEEQWPLRPVSHTITQWMNGQAVYGSWQFIGCTEEAISLILTHNNGRGMPFHSHGALTSLIGERSEFHQMSVNARRRIADLFNASVDQHPNIPEIDGIIAATIWHAAEHYYTSMMFPKEGNIVPLRTDLSGVIMCIVGPINYWTRRVLVSQNLDDPICKILYEEAVKVNPDFANNALSIGCSY